MLRPELKNRYGKASNKKRTSMKKTLHYKMLFLIAMITLPMNIMAAETKDVTIGGFKYWIHTGYSYAVGSIVRYEYDWATCCGLVKDSLGNYPSSITILDSITYEGKVYPVKDVTNFVNLDKLISVTLPEGLEEVSGFSSCTSLKNINLPSTLRSIDKGAFQKCTALTTIVLPDSLEAIRAYAFMNCSALSTVKLPDSLHFIGQQAFSRTNIEAISIPDKIEAIEWGTFEGCSNLKTIHLPEGLRRIGREAFRGCISLQAIDLPSTIQEISEEGYGGSNFANCKALKEITIPHSVRVLPESIFNGCTNLKHITLPDSLTEIRDYAFGDCKNLVSMIIPEHVNEISKNIFSGCDSLKYVIVKTKEKNAAKTFCFGASKLTAIVPLSRYSTYKEIADSLNSLTYGWRRYNLVVLPYKELPNGMGTAACIDAIDLDSTIECNADFIDFSNNVIDGIPPTLAQNFHAYECNNYADGNIDTKEIEGIVPTGKGFMISGKQNNAYIFHIVSTSSQAKSVGKAAISSDNMLIGCTEDTDLSTLTNAYIFENGYFVHKNSGILEAGNSYLTLPAGVPETIGLTGDLVVNGIEHVITDRAADNNIWFDLSGHWYKLKPTAKGVYIHNGQKVIIK